ncbi:MAG: SnoaL-like domain [Solirubrobacterales bacterium]|jgi:ketosteroid isomerase-like protein|nr:SnoaL-like domain [Solirubrobacterales bacterium]
MSSHADVATVRRWFDAFNSRNLEGMLACMHPYVDFHPLRLPGLESAYSGHAGVREWFAELLRLEHHHRIELAEVSASSGGKLVAAGTLRAGDPAAPASFWALERFEGGMIIASHHFLSDRFHLR